MEVKTVYLSLGSNQGDRIEYLKKALERLQTFGQVIRCSNVYETPAWGFESDDTFFNICTEFTTTLSPFELLDRIHEIEKSLGRIRSAKKGYESRPIDLDIILFNDLILDSENLKIPHPEYSKRDFVLFPLNDLVPDYFDQQLNKTVHEMTMELNSKTIIKCLNLRLFN